MGRERKSSCSRNQRKVNVCSSVGLTPTRCEDTANNWCYSPVGLEAVLEQEDLTFKPIYYASRKLSNVERRYSQFEKEALAVRWACEKFYRYLYGIEFEICTDHKPLVIVLEFNTSLHIFEVRTTAQMPSTACQ